MRVQVLFCIKCEALCMCLCKFDMHLCTIYCVCVCVCVHTHTHTHVLRMVGEGGHYKCHLGARPSFLLSRPPYPLPTPRQTHIGYGLFKTIIHLMQVKELKAAVAHELSNRYSSVLASLKSTSVFGMLRSSRSVVAQPSQASSQRSGSSRASPGGGAALRAPQIGGPDAVGRGLQGGGLYIV
jgi:hypothetical protein